MRSTKAIDRILVLIALSYLFCIIGSGIYKKFGIGVNHVRNMTKQEQVVWIYDNAKKGVPLSYIKQILKIF